MPDWLECRSLKQNHANWHLSHAMSIALVELCRNKTCWFLSIFRRPSSKATQPSRVPCVSARGLGFQFHFRTQHLIEEIDKMHRNRLTECGFTTQAFHVISVDFLVGRKEHQFMSRFVWILQLRFSVSKGTLSEGPSSLEPDRPTFWLVRKRRTSKKSSWLHDFKIGNSDFKLDLIAKTVKL